MVLRNAVEILFVFAYLSLGNIQLGDNMHVKRAIRKSQTIDSQVWIVVGVSGSWEKVDCFTSSSSSFGV